jgi:hypothetical protein
MEFGEEGGGFADVGFDGCRFADEGVGLALSIGVDALDEVVWGGL